MKKKFPVWGILLLAFAAVALIFGVMFIGPYNKIVSLDEQVTTAQANIQSQLQSRLDKINEMLPAVQSVLDKEDALTKELAQLAQTPGITGTSGSFKLESDASLNDLESVDTVSGQFASDLVSLLKNNADLNSGTAVQDFMTSMEGAENRISYAREKYNEVVAEYNRYIRSFPHNVTASLFGFGPKDKFEASSAANESVEINFS